MRVPIRRFIIVFLITYLVMTCYSLYMLLNRSNKQDHDSINDQKEESWNPWGPELENDRVNKVAEAQHDWNITNEDKSNEDFNDESEHVVEIWGKAAIGDYLWEHILEGKVTLKENGLWKYGAKKINNTLFRYRTGPAIVQDRVPADVKNLVIVLNGREPSKVDFAKAWLDYLPKYSQLINVGLVLLGNERCENDWIFPYLRRNGGIVKFVFLVYDSPDIDDVDVFQWPLGVATYRGFPALKKSDIDLNKEREYICNFLGTIYVNSSRETLLKVLTHPKLKDFCLVKPRLQWMPKETSSTREMYISALASSDLTLNPIGMNTECYRLYEAFSFGSLPVVENVMTPGRCSAPLRLLKRYNAPVLYVEHWSHLVSLLLEEDLLPVAEVVKRRKGLLHWYQWFKSEMRFRFHDVVRRKFFTTTNR